jgi:biotin carboxylase
MLTEGFISRRTILFVGGGTETVPAVKTAKDMNLKVIVSDMDPNAPCSKDADYFIQSSTYDYDGTIGKIDSYVKTNEPIDGVICVATDVPFTVAKIAEYFKLPGIPVNSAKIVSDKLLMKDAFASCKLPVPWYTEIKSENELAELRKKKYFPLVIKPVDSRGARGVLKLADDIDLKWAYKYALNESPTSRIMVEKFMPGPQVSTESLIVNGISHTIGFSDRNYEYLDLYFPHFIENGGQLPSFLNINVQHSINNLIEKAALSLGIKNGVIKGDIVITDGKPYIIEVAARLSGGYFCTHEIPLNTGINFVELAIKQSLGDTIFVKDLQKKINNPVAQRYIFPKPGKVVDINIPDWINKDEEINFFEVRIKKGDTVPKTQNHPSRSGVVITTSNTVDAAIKKAEKVISSVKIVTK